MGWELRFSQLIRLSSWRTGVVVIAAICVLGLGGCHAAARSSAPKASRLDAIEGDMLCRPGGAAWGVRGSEAILIVASGTCGSCQADLPFEERLWLSAREQGLPVYYVIADRDSNRARIGELRSGGRTVISLDSLQEFGIARVPTIARLDNSGRILSKWTGNVLKEDSERVLASILHGVSVYSYRRISQSEMRERVTTRQVQVLAFSPSRRDLSVPAKIIPPAQVFVRAKREMNPNASIVVDCTRVNGGLACQDVALELATAGFPDVALAGLDQPYISPCGGRQ
jgi:hypothetical protein